MPQSPQAILVWPGPHPHTDLLRYTECFQSVPRAAQCQGHMGIQRWTALFSCAHILVAGVGPRVKETPLVVREEERGLPLGRGI